MTYIPDCRTDEFYNEKNLTGADKVFLQGYDWAVAQIDSLFDNLEVFPELERLLEDKTALIMDGKAEVARACLAEWAEMERDELITSMIDAAEDEQ